MADADKTKDEAAAASGGVMGTIIGFIVLALLAMGVAVGIAWYEHGKLAKEASAKEACGPAKQELAKLGDSVSVVRSIPSILTNLAGEGAPWLRLDLSVVLPRSFPEEEKTLAELGQDFLSFVRTLRPDQIAGGTNLDLLRADLKEIARIRTDGAALDVLVRNIILE